MTDVVRSANADRLLRFVRAGASLAERAVEATRREDDGTRAHADRLVGHWRRELAPLVAVPGLGGRLTRTVVEVLAATAQGLLVLSLAELQGVTDETERVRLVARLALDEDLPQDWSAETAQDPGEADDEDEDDDRAAWQVVLQRVPKAVFATAREMWAVWRLAGKRRSGGRLWHRALSMVPVVGVAATVLGERHAVQEIAERAYAELEIPAAST